MGIGGAYLCVYGMEGPGGYQLIGRTVQMWNRWRRTNDFAEPWLLRPFDQIRFHPVSVDELHELRADLPSGRASVATEPVTFSLAAHRMFLAGQQMEIERFTATRQQAFAEERARWAEEAPIPIGMRAVRSPMAGVVSRFADVGCNVAAGDPLVWIEAMKTETALIAEQDGVLNEVRVGVGQTVPAGMVVAVVDGRVSSGNRS